MASTVNAAFNEFLKNKVNLDPTITCIARGSRDWLVEQIHSFPQKDCNFPDLYTEKDIYFGSFARKTKKRELDDIDLMICLTAEGGTYYDYGTYVSITIPATAARLSKLCNDGVNSLNSKKVINKFITLLDKVPQYYKAGLNRNQEAAVLNLTSYTWSFDIIPCFFTQPDPFTNNTYYLIPDGSGNWKKTDPRKDRERVSTVNQRHNGYVLSVIRTLKYWNKRATMPTMPSYLLENMILDYYSTSYPDKATPWVDLQILNLLNYIQTAIYMPVYDPKHLQGDLNTLSYSDKEKISNRAQIDLQKANEAHVFEMNQDHQRAINKWGEVFGCDFPQYS